MLNSSLHAFPASTTALDATYNSFKYFYKILMGVLVFSINFYYYIVIPVHLSIQSATYLFHAIRMLLVCTMQIQTMKQQQYFCVPDGQCMFRML